MSNQHVAAAPASTSAAPPAPAPADPWNMWQGLSFMAVSLLLGITQGLGVNLVNSNLTGIQGSLGATAAEASWLTTAYFATNITASLLLTKVRYQYGLRLFADVVIVLFLLLALAHLFTQHLGSAIAVRAALGLAAAPISSLAVLYMVQAFPPARAMTGAVLGFAMTQIGAPLSRIISEELLQNGQWQGIHLVDAALAILCVAAINVVRPKHVPTQKMFARGDGIVFTLYALALGLLCVVLTQGRLRWWSDTPWLGVCLAGAVLCFGLYLVIELRREKPLLDLHWLASPFMLRFMAAILLFRIVLSEQSVGAVGLMNTLGFTNDQMHLLFVFVTVGTMAGFGLALLALPSRRFGLLGDAALVLIMLAAWMDGQSTVLTRPHDLYLSQTLLAAASSMFLASAMLQGFGHVIAGGMKNLISFIAVFSGGQALAGLVGQAWLSTLLAERQRLHYGQLVEHLQQSDPQVVQRLAQLGGAYAATLNDAAARGNQALTLLSQQVTQQSYVMAYNDLFHTVALTSTLGFLVFAGIKTHRWHRARRNTPAAELPATSS
ncbi:MFS transporter [Polaromonas jejuensis]|uniref:MFS transporter n=1 Tax=Polaromonas jejuensis TaxID=457502 RepID=A0ABW0Q6S1_9BURK|nr:MFS transporter [Polaromonas jejuensis]